MLIVDDPQRAVLASLCRQFGVRRLDLFGSAARQHDFDPERSDVDLIVEFEAGAARKSWANYFDLKTGLEALFGRPVDLIEQGALQNPYILASVGRDRRPLYGA